MMTSVGRLSDEQVRTVLHAADTAPSPTVDLPWRFQLTDSSIELHDVGLNGARRILACGGALLNLRLAVQEFGVSADVRLTPDPAVPGLLATVRTENERLATTWERQLARTSQDTESAYFTAPITPATPAATLSELRRAAEIEQAWLAPLSADDAAVIHAPINGLVVVIGSLHDDVRALLRAGQAIRRVMLTAMTLGLRAAEVPGPVADDVARAELRALIGGALFPHAVLALTN